MSKQVTYTRNIRIILIVLLCIAFTIESQARMSNSNTSTNKRREKSIINLCSKDIDMKLGCHCSHDDFKRTVIEVDCLVLHQEFPQSDPSWLSFRSHPNLKHFVLTVHRNGHMSYIPSDVLKYQKELRTITITYADIREIPEYAFGNLSKLENITLTKCQIEELHIHSFANHEALTNINLEDNQIIEINRYAFMNLPELQELWLTKNNLTVLHEEMFVDLGKLSKLKLNENLISVLTREVFKGLGNLKILDLSFNSIKFIGDTVFAELWSLQELDLENNSIERLSERAFDGLNNLRIINLNNNKLSMLESGVFTGVPALINLNLNNNLLDSLTTNNMLPLMDNLVNNTSTLSISDNKFVCDCRMYWVYDVYNRTKNPELKRQLHTIQCTIEKLLFENAFNDNFNAFNGLQHHNSRYPNEDDEILLANHLELLPPYNNYQSQQHVTSLQRPATSVYNKNYNYDNRQSQNSIVGLPTSTETRLIELLNISPEKLPCESNADPTELPLSRESIGMDLSWLSGSGSSNFHLAQSVGLFLAIVSVVITIKVLSS